MRFKTIINFRNILTLLVGLVIYGVIIGLGFAVVYSLNYAIDGNNNLFNRIIALLVSFFLLIFSTVQFFSLRRNNETRLYYGYIEIIIGFFNLLIVFLNILSNAHLFFLVYSSLYVMIRGLDNIDQYHRNKPEGGVEKVPHFLKKDLLFTTLLLKFLKVYPN